MYRRSPALFCLVLCLLAGCSAVSPPAATESPANQTVDLSLLNDGDRPVRISVYAIPESIESVRISYADGRTETVAVTRLSDLSTGDLEKVTAVEPLGSGAQSVSRILGPGDGVGTKLSTERSATILYVVSGVSGESTSNGSSATSRLGITRCSESSHTRLTIEVGPERGMRVEATCGE